MSRPEPVGVTANDIIGWRSQQIMVFLDNLINSGPRVLSSERLESMDGLYGLTQTRNVEVSFRWLLLCLKNNRRACLPAVENFLGYHGRGSYVKPVYAALATFDHGAAVACFKKHGNFYQKVIAAQVRELLKLDDVATEASKGTKRGRT